MQPSTTVHVSSSTNDHDSTRALEEDKQKNAALGRMPEEILVHVFRLMFKDRDTPRPIAYFHAPDILSPVNLNWPELQLCRRIWEIAVQTPQLWTWLPMGCIQYSTRSEWIDLCIMRSGTAPMDVFAYFGLDKVVIEYVRRLAPRIRRLLLEIDSIGESLTTQYDRRKMSIMLSSLSDRRWDCLEQVSLRLPRGVYDGSVREGLLPRSWSTLSELHLGDFSWSLDGVIPGNVLRIITIRGLEPHTAHDLRTWFSNFPHLEHLHLQFTMKSAFGLDIPYEHARPVALPLLRTLSLHGYPAHLLNALPSFPDPLEDLTVRCDWDWPPIIGDHQTFVIDSVLDYWDRNIHDLNAESEPDYTFALGKLQSPYSKMCFSFAPSDNSEQSRRLVFRGERADRNVINTFAGLARTVCLTEVDEWTELTQEVCDSSSIERIFFSPWSSRGACFSSSVPGIYSLLYARSQTRGALGALMIDEKVSDELRELESLWKDQGLIEELRSGVFYDFGSEFERLPPHSCM